MKHISKHHPRKDPVINQPNISMECRVHRFWSLLYLYFWWILTSSFRWGVFFLQVSRTKRWEKNASFWSKRRGPPFWYVYIYFFWGGWKTWVWEKIPKKIQKSMQKYLRVKVIIHESFTVFFGPFLSILWRTWFPGNKKHIWATKKPSYFPLNPGRLIGILIKVYYNASITG